jgi:predicted TIM-barrel fold metal-dependent hydrolase
MDQGGTAKALLSVSTPGVTPAGTAAEAADMARLVNDAAAEVVKDRPDRFGFLATVPLPAVDVAVAEAARALDELRADGLILLAHSGDTYLGDAAQMDLFAELDRRRTVVLVHPGPLPGPAVPKVPPLAADFLLDTTRAAYLLVRTGVVARYRASGSS